MPNVELAFTNKRPLSVTIIGWVYIAVGAIGFAYHSTEFSQQPSFQYDIVWVELLRLLAVPGGIRICRG